MGGVANAAIVVTAMVVVISCCMMQVAEAQTASCLTVAGGSAPYADAATVVQRLRVMPGQCCNGSGSCRVVAQSGNAAATICGFGAYSGNYCVSCANMGNALNVVLSRCNLQNTVQGVYSPAGDGTRLLYITSASSHP